VAMVLNGIAARPAEQTGMDAALDRLEGLVERMEDGGC